MAKIVYVVQIVREFSSEKEAAQAAKRAAKSADNTVSLFEEKRTVSGQAFHRTTVWTNKPRDCPTCPK